MAQRRKGIYGLLLLVGMLNCIEADPITFAMDEPSNLPACNVGIALAARQTISILKVTLPLWLSLDYECHYHLAIAISNVTLHTEELNLMMAASRNRPRTYVVVANEHQDISPERNAAVKVST